MGRPYAFDFGAIMMMGAALGADAELLAEVLPAAEAAMLAGLAGDDED